MAFLIEEKKPAMAIEEKQTALNKEISSLIKARGFEANGTYKFRPNNNVNNRRDGSIVSGSVSGDFTLNEDMVDELVFERECFPEKIWKRICGIMGYKYHVPTDIDKFVVNPKSISVSVNIVTPTTEE